MAIVRIILGVIIGVVLGLGVVILADKLNHMMFPPPPHPEWRDYAINAPFYKLIALPLGYAIAAFIAAFAAIKIAARALAGWIAGGLLVAATFANLVMIIHPLWMTVACIVFVPAAAWFGVKLAAPKAQSLTQ